MKKDCSKCNKPLEESRVGLKRYCKSCSNEWMRLNRKKHSELNSVQKKKSNARSYLNVYIKRGKILKQPCEKCGNVDAEGHHDDYDKPLDVVWLCRSCHLHFHKNNI